jgi:hypothetical protein
LPSSSLSCLKLSLLRRRRKGFCKDGRENGIGKRDAKGLEIWMRIVVEKEGKELERTGKAISE